MTAYHARARTLATAAPWTVVASVQTLGSARLQIRRRSSGIGEGR